jgi:DNA repair exonuclease SbcCD nuclease subunit
MGEIIAGFKDTLIGPWLLIGHGDYLSSMKELNTYETGIYMPLSRTDIEYYEPAKVILGHIHKKTNFGKVHYPGSPCGMDINEIGKRSFLIMDLNSLEISEKTVETDYIFFNEILISLPTSNEFDYIKNKITDLINKWNLSKDEIPKARIRLKVKGYTSDKKKLESVIKEKLNSFTYYNNEQPDLIETSVFSDPERIDIVEIVKKEIDALEENLGYIQSEKDDIIEQALHIILRE